jgi:hypothetical protein
METEDFNYFSHEYQNGALLEENMDLVMRNHATYGSVLNENMDLVEKSHGTIGSLLDEDMNLVYRNHGTIGSLLGADMEEERGQLQQLVQQLPELIAVNR